jgi:hypothetical protein
VSTLGGKGELGAWSTIDPHASLSNDYGERAPLNDCIRSNYSNTSLRIHMIPEAILEPGNAVALKMPVESGAYSNQVI